MIVDALVTALSSLVAWLFGLMPRLPVWDGPAIASAVSTFVSWFGPPLTALNFYLPVYLWMHLIFVICGLEVAQAGWSVVKFVAGFVRGVAIG